MLFNELLQILGCSDIDECTDNSTYTSNYCNNLASCTNNVGSWTCTCNTGKGSLQKKKKNKKWGNFPQGGGVWAHSTLFCKKQTWS